MSNHKRAIIPVETWCYGSPDLRTSEKSLDMGLIMEGLLYYENVLLSLGSQQQLADLLQWFQEQGALEGFFKLVSDGIVEFHEYSFATVAIRKGNTYSIYNIQDENQIKPNSFLERYLQHEIVIAAFSDQKLHKMFCEVVTGHVIEEKSDEYKLSVEAARNDLQEPQRCNLVLQAFLDELYPIRNAGTPPQIETTVVPTENGRTINWGIKIQDISDLAGKELNFHGGTPITGAAVANRLLHSASRHNCDLYLPRPMGMVVGDKLFEATRSISDPQIIPDQLEEEVEFPDVRALVNQGSLNFAQILEIRSKAERFRNWLQNEADRDRNAIIAYHHEVAKESGFSSACRKGLHLFGVIGGSATGSVIGTALGGLPGAAIGAAAGAGIGYLSDLGSKLGTNWRPVVFGHWIQDRIEKVISENREDAES